MTSALRTHNDDDPLLARDEAAREAERGLQLRPLQPQRIPCGDEPGAWAPALNGTLAEWVRLEFFDAPVYAQKLEVWEVNAAPFITRLKAWRLMGSMMCALAG